LSEVETKEDSCCSCLNLHGRSNPWFRLRSTSGWGSCLTSGWDFVFFTKPDPRAKLMTRRFAGIAIPVSWALVNFRRLSEVETKENPF